MNPLFLLNPHLDTDSGDLFSLVWQSSTSTLYFGCQNTSIQWFDFRGPPQVSSEMNSPQLADQPGSRSRAPQPSSNLSTPGSRSESIDRLLIDTSFTSGTSTPRRVHKFFDSYPQYERRTPDLNARNPSLNNAMTPPSTPPQPQVVSSPDSCLVPPSAQPSIRTLQVLPENTIWSAHYGYVYSLALVPSSREGSDDVARHNPECAQLVSGSGDATVKVGLQLDAKRCPVLTEICFRCGLWPPRPPHYNTRSNAVMEQY